MLADAEREYEETSAALINAAPSLRQEMLAFRQSQIDEARSMIATFEGANAREG